MKQKVNRLYIILPAAGQSRRMGSTGNKLLIPIHGISVIERTLQAISRFAEEKNLAIHIVIATSDNFRPELENILQKPLYSFVEKIIAGGKTRQESVYRAIRAMETLSLPPHSEDILFIHDAARCLIDTETLSRCLDDTRTHKICVAAVPVKDTIKQTQKGKSVVMQTLERDTLYVIQTPQAFTWQIAKESYENAAQKGIESTDDTSLAEVLGYPVHLTLGSYQNLKITTWEDVRIAEFLADENPAL